MLKRRIGLCSAENYEEYGTNWMSYYASYRIQTSKKRRAGTHIETVICCNRDHNSLVDSRAGRHLIHRVGHRGGGSAGGKPPFFGGDFRPPAWD